MSYLAILLKALTYEMLSCSWFYRFGLFMFLVLQIPAFHVPGFTDSGFSCSWFYRFRLFMFLVLRIPVFHVPGFLVPRSVPCSVPRFPVPCFTDSHCFVVCLAQLLPACNTYAIKIFHTLISMISRHLHCLHSLPFWANISSYHVMH